MIQEILNKVDNLNISDFTKHFYNQQKPVVVKNYVLSKYLQKLSFKTLLDNFGEAQIPVNFMSLDFDPQEYFNSPSRYFESTGKTMHLAEGNLGEFIEFVQAHNVPPKTGVYSIANLDVHKINSELKELIEPPIYVSLFGNYRTTLWVGPFYKKWSLHRDLQPIVMAHLCGKKRFLFIDPKEMPQELIHKKNKLIAKFSDLNALRESLSPMLNNVKVYSVDLEESDILFIPKGWWHQVIYLENCLSVTFIKQ